MLSSTVLLLGTQLLLTGVAAHDKDWWMQGLPKCWQGCFSDTEQGCASSKCICKTSDSSTSYLPAAVTCAVSKCNADEWALDLVLGPLALYCAAIQCAIPEEVMTDAYAAAADSDDDEPPRPTPKPPTPPSSSSKPSGPQKTTKAGDDTPQLTSTIRSTFTRTTTENGNTLQVVVPIVIGPSGMVTGSASTSTITGKTSSTGAAQSSVAASPRPSAAAPSQPSSQHAMPTSTSAPQSTQRPASGNGSPFDNMQAGAARWLVSVPMLGLGAIAMLFVRL